MEGSSIRSTRENKTHRGRQSEKTGLNIEAGGCITRGGGGVTVIYRAQSGSAGSRTEGWDTGGSINSLSKVYDEAATYVLAVVTVDVVLLEGGLISNEDDLA